MLLTWRTRWWYALGAALCLLLASLLQGPLTNQRLRERLVMRSDTSGMPPEYILTSALLGGFRSLAVQLLWYRAQTMKNDGQYHEMVDLYNIITKLQPGHHQAWAFQAWDLSYNVSVEFHNLEDRVFWLFRGIDLLRLQGIPKSDGVPELASECSWIIQHKLGKTLDYAHPYYRVYLARQMEFILRTDGDADMQRRIVDGVAGVPRHPADFDRLEGFAAARAKLADVGVDPWGDWSALGDGPGARADAKALVERDPAIRAALRSVQFWRVGEEIRNRLGMDPIRMRAMTERYGALDWRSAFSHSLYWAEVAYDTWWKKPDKKADLKFERFAYFSLIDLTRHGRAVWGDDGFVHYLPDYTKVDAVVKHMDEVFRRFRHWRDASGMTASLTGSHSGFHYFLRDAIFRAYFEGRRAQAEALLRRLIVNEWQRELRWEAERLRLTPAQIATVEDGDYDRIVAFLPVPAAYAGTIDDYFGNLLGEFLESPTVDRIQMLLESNLLNAYRALALGDETLYQDRAGMVDTIYREYVLVRWPQKSPEFGDDYDNRHFIAPLIDLRVNALVRLLENRMEDAPLAFEPGGGGTGGLSLAEGGMALTDALKQQLVLRLQREEPETLEALRRRVEQIRRRAEAEAAAAEAVAPPR